MRESLKGKLSSQC